MKKNNFVRFFCVLILSGLCCVKSFASGTIVGNGGDPIFEFMRATKESMIDTIKFVLNEEDEMKSFCHLKNMNAEQVKFCKEYFNAIALEVLSLSQGTKQTPFVLREEPLYVMGPDGQPMIVSARTELGPAGPIEIHRDSVKVLAPTQVLFLLTHEFLHKVFFQGRSVSDNEQIGPFAYGRDLLDSVASSLVAVAKRKGKIGTQFGIRDIFQCRAESSGVQFGAQIVSSRLFQTENLMSYETSVGKNPLDGSIFFQERSTTNLRLRFTIKEPNNCGADDSGRGMSVQIVRSSLSPNSKQEEVLATLNIAVNPMCPLANTSFEISHQQIKFSCVYFGSEGTTSSPFSLSGN